MRTRHSRTTDGADARRRGRERPARDGETGWPSDGETEAPLDETGYAGRRRRGGERWPGDADGYDGRDPRAARSYGTDPNREPRLDDGQHGRTTGPPVSSGRDSRPAGDPDRDSHGRRTDGRDNLTRDSSARDSRGKDLSAAAAPVVRTPTGWRVGDEEVSDLTSAMVLADLLAADLPAEGPPTPSAPPAPEAQRPAPPQAPRGPGVPERAGSGPAADIRKLQETVAQLEHALMVRVRVEQAIGVLAERHRLRPRQAFELLRSAARARGRRVMEVANEVVDSAANPLLRIPDELAKPPGARRRGRGPRHMLGRD